LITRIYDDIAKNYRYIVEPCQNIVEFEELKKKFNQELSARKYLVGEKHYF